MKLTLLVKFVIFAFVNFLNLVKLSYYSFFKEKVPLFSSKLRDKTC